MIYDPNDPLMAKLINALWRGEGSPGPNQGFDYTDLSGAPRDQFGFPIWPGVWLHGKHTSAAGREQFEHGTWDRIALQNPRLDFRNAADQDAGAWALAEEVVPNLYAMLRAGRWRSVGLRLQRTWPGGALAVMKET